MTSRGNVGRLRELLKSERVSLLLRKLVASPWQTTAHPIADCYLAVATLLDTDVSTSIDVSGPE